MRRQQGVGLIGLVLLLGGLGFIALMALKLVPAYMDYFAIKRALSNTVQSPESKNATVNDLRRGLDRRFEVDNIKAITSAEVDITREGGGVVMSASYSAKVPLFGNISACMEFNATSAP